MTTWKEARTVAQAQNCQHALAVAVRVTGDSTPPDDAEAVVVCKEKLRWYGYKSDLCDGNCPL